MNIFLGYMTVVYLWEKFRKWVWKYGKNIGVWEPPMVVDICHFSSCPHLKTCPMFVISMNIVDR